MVASQSREAIINLIADAEESGKLKVLVDGDGMKLLMDIWQDYVSDDDYRDYMNFMQEVDSLLLKYRGGKPLTREERENFDEEAALTKRAKKKKKKQKKVEPSSENTDTQQPSNDTEVTSSDFNTRAVAHYVSRQMQGLG